ncbi:hypothetical protein WA158_003382 [Blastocystis sp. Blastoise]
MQLSIYVANSIQLEGNINEGTISSYGYELATKPVTNYNISVCLSSLQDISKLGDFAVVLDVSVSIGVKPGGEGAGYGGRGGDGSSGYGSLGEISYSNYDKSLQIEVNHGSGGGDGSDGRIFFTFPCLFNDTYNHGNTTLHIGHGTLFIENNRDSSISIYKGSSENQNNHEYSSIPSIMYSTRGDAGGMNDDPNYHGIMVLLVLFGHL